MKDTCLLNAFAWALRLDPQYLASQMEKPSEAGYHTQQFIEYCMSIGKAVILIERTPVLEHPVNSQYFLAKFPGEMPGARFLRHIKDSRGVLLGRHKLSTLPHAMVNRFGVVEDVFNIYHVETLQDLNMDSFVPTYYLRIE